MIDNERIEGVTARDFVFAVIATSIVASMTVFGMLKMSVINNDATAQENRELRAKIENHGIVDHLVPMIKIDDQDRRSA